MIRILQINTEKKIGGAARIADTLHRGLNERSDNISFIAHGRGSISEDPSVYKFSLWPEIYAHTLITRLTGFEGFGTYYSTRNLINFIKIKAIDIIHLHNIHGYYLNFNFFFNFIKSNRLPVIWTFHDCWPFTGSCAYPYNCNKYSNGCGECSYLKRYPKNYKDSSRRMLELKEDLFVPDCYPVIVTPSKWLRDLVKKTFFYKCQIEMIPNGIDVETFKPVNKEKAKEMLKLPPKSKVVLFVAADLTDERKGMNYFLKAINEISDIENLIIITVGKKYNDNLNIKIAFKEYGFIPEQDIIAAVYSAADLFCVTSLDEVFGLTVTEAMACGTPVVGFSVGGIKEQVTENCGLLVPPKDYISLAAAVKELLANKSKRMIMSQNCREKVIKQYSEDILVDSYAKLYLKLLERSAYRETVRQ